MNVLAGTHPYYCGIDLHARTMYVCILNGDGNKVYHKNILAGLTGFYKPSNHFARGLIVEVECIFC